MREIKFGYGKVSVCPCTWNELPTLLLEDGKGGGVLGAPIVDREQGMLVYPETLGEKAYVLSFKNVEGLDILIENLQNLRTAFTGEDNEHTDNN